MSAHNLTFDTKILSPNIVNRIKIAIMWIRGGKIQIPIRLFPIELAQRIVEDKHNLTIQPNSDVKH